MPRQGDRAITGYTFHVHLTVGITDLAEAEAFIAEQLAARFGAEGEGEDWHQGGKEYPRWSRGPVLAVYKVEDPY